MFKFSRPIIGPATRNVSISTFPIIRSFSSSSINLKVDDAKAKLMREQKLRAKHRQGPESHPLYMTVPQAMRYLRAAEVGRPVKRSTVSISMTIIPEKGSTPISGSVYLPKPIKDNFVMVFSLDEEVIKKAKEMGATLAGGLELIQGINEGTIKFDKITQAFATPDIVKSLKPIARQIGPKGLMPTEKRGTVSDDIASLISESVGALAFKQKGTDLSIAIGRCDFSDEEIIKNLIAASTAIYAAQPPGTPKPNLFGLTHISSTFGPSIVIDIKP
ncbi:ribosomal protein L1-like protein [Scheffersomyces amazonensis]|uniref:ribosomal protein L1-like protein n=1 Tax=Scheffersomyces amazonensis TaxID=1078765 RepID=UPI00315CF9A4